MLRKCVLLASLSLFSIPALLHGQAIPAGRGGSHLSAGGFFSAFRPDYGPNELMGMGFYLDFNVGAHLSAEAEGRFLRIHQTLDVHEDNYLIGPRYRFYWHRTHPYVKFLFGNGQFNFPFDYAHGGYFVMAPGGGVDMNLPHHFIWKIADYEYQHWSSFQGSSLSPNGFSTGIAYRIF